METRYLVQEIVFIGYLMRCHYLYTLSMFNEVIQATFRGHCDVASFVLVFYSNPILALS